MLAGCGGSQPPIGAAGAMPQRSVALHHVTHSASWMSAKVNYRHPWLYVADTTKSNIYIYDLDHGASQIGEISAGLGGPFGMTIDGSGNLYVANQNIPGNVAIYPPGKTKPTLTLSEDLYVPQGVAVDSGGNVWITNREYDGGQSGIAVFPPGETTPSAYITSNLIQKPIEDFFDQEGNLYFSDQDTGVSEIARGSQQVASLELQDLAHADGVVLGASGNLYVNDYPSYATHVYALGGKEPSYNLQGHAASYYMADGTIGFRNYIFLADWYSGRVFMYRDDASKKPYATIDTPSENTGGVAFKPAGVP
jgi:sugar lactone lactonase YvrE